MAQSPEERAPVIGWFVPGGAEERVCACAVCAAVADVTGALVTGFRDGEVLEEEVHRRDWIVAAHGPVSQGETVV